MKREDVKAIVLTEKYRLKTDESWFFYSKLKKHYSNRRLGTGDGEGYWKKWSTTNVTNGADQTIIGRRKDLRFYKYRGGGATAMKTNWIMCEYSSSSTTTNNGPEPVGELLQMQKQYKLITPGSSVLDLGCALGAWLQGCVCFTRLTYGFDFKGNVCGDKRAKPNLHVFELRDTLLILKKLGQS